MSVLPLGFLYAAGNMQHISYVLISVALRYICVLHLALFFQVFCISTLTLSRPKPFTSGQE